MGSLADLMCIVRMQLQEQHLQLMFANTYFAIVTNALLPIFAISCYQDVWKHFFLYTNTPFSNAWPLAKVVLPSARGSK